MKHYNHELKMYAEAGLRSAEDWGTLGRIVEAGNEPRTSTIHRGQTISLYGRDQTVRRPRVRADRPKVAAVTAPAATPAEVPASSETTAG